MSTKSTAAFSPLFLMTLAAFFCLSAGWTPAGAQSARSLVQEGNQEYSSGNFQTAETRYRAALAADSLQPSPISAFNLGDALFKQERYNEAIEQFAGVAADADMADDQRAAAWHNQGNAWAALEDYPKAINAYKQALRLNPRDFDTKHNLAWAQEKLREQQQQSDQNQKQNGDQQQDGQNQQNGDQQQDGQNQQNGDQQQNGQNQQNGDQQQNGQNQQNGDQQQDGQNQQNGDQQQDGQNQQNGDQQQDGQNQQNGDQQQDGQNQQNGDQQQNGQNQQNGDQQQNGEDGKGMKDANNNGIDDELENQKGEQQSEQSGEEGPDKNGPDKNGNGAAAGQGQDGQDDAEQRDAQGRVITISREDALRMLQALQQQEQALQQQLRRRTGKARKTEKDW